METRLLWTSCGVGVDVSAAAVAGETEWGAVTMCALADVGFQRVPPYLDETLLSSMEEIGVAWARMKQDGSFKNMSLSHNINPLHRVYQQGTGTEGT